MGLPLMAEAKRRLRLLSTWYWLWLSPARGEDVFDALERDADAVFWKAEAERLKKELDEEKEAYRALSVEFNGFLAFVEKFRDDVVEWTGEDEDLES